MRRWLKIKRGDAIVRALVGLGSGLGLEVIAEGVESEEQRRLLIEHGCDQAQGTYYGGTITAADAFSLAEPREMDGR